MRHNVRADVRTPWPAGVAAMFPFSPTCYRLTSDALDTLPPAYRHRTAEPTHWAVREVVWACWVAAVGRLLDGGPWPSELAVGREGATLPVPPLAWDDFQAELGLNHPDAHDRAAYLLRAQLRPFDTTPEPHSPRDAMPPLLVGLVAVTCWLDQLNRDGGGDPRFPPRVIGRAVARHPSPAAFGPVDEAAAHRAVSDYLRLQRGMDGGAFRPLQMWLTARATAAPPPVTLSAGLFDEPPPPPVAPPPPPPVQPVETRTTSAATVVQLLDVLTAVFDPLLWADAPPVRANTLTPAAGERLTEAVGRWLGQDGVEVYGEPGATVTLTLPQSAWRLDDRLPPLSGGDGPRAYRVNRRGLLVNGRVVLPALVAPQEGSDE